MNSNTHTDSRYTFPENFMWGVAAAAPQIEGAAYEDGKGESVWDAYAKIPGKIKNGDNLDQACDHYHRFPEDFKLMRELGIKDYRLSIAWPRIFPNGDGDINQAGLDFYHRLFDSMETNGITPWVTCFHWDLPQSLETRFGGWRSRKTVDAFAHYAETIVKAFGSRVKNWFTINEIVAFTRRAYGMERNAPGIVCDTKTINQTYHHALLCHGHAVQAVRQYGQPGSRVGLVDNPLVPIPITDSKADIQAARACFAEDSRRVLDPLYRGEYTADYIKEYGAENLPDVQAGDFDLITEPCDLIGLNIYWGYYVRADAEGKPERVPFPPDYPAASVDWLKITPESLYWGPRHIRDIYGEQTIYIAENGCGYHDEPLNEKGECLDLQRRDLIRNYLKELHRAIQDGVDVQGYFLWSFMDNFEWGEGYGIRFGITHMDYTTLKRTPKLSAYWYAEVIRNNALYHGENSQSATARTELSALAT
ncbi:GH1 family beta-glucosidase [Coraliomargarita algicola]|uniref:Beta-glucosidase n=1 Tax=Coraliomargarita algicola TaxID=3092156 RepID=A0ABZ0RPQ2_9BACT|nr:GH1 family beta-glucosidase [Coraliomargarita sp. J2-16]WPJ97101.1 GH1 family beta-glucosidase [Coraliomargarita sp. J2-16]